MLIAINGAAKNDYSLLQLIKPDQCTEHDLGCKFVFCDVD